MVDIDPTVIGDYGVGVVGLIVMYLSVKGFFAVWGKSIDTQDKNTDALNRNTDAYRQLARVLDESSHREQEFQTAILTIVQDTNDKVSEIHKQL